MATFERIILRTNCCPGIASLILQYHCVLFLFLKVFMGKDDKRVHLGAAGLSAFAGKKLIEMFEK